MERSILKDIVFFVIRIFALLCGCYILVLLTEIIARLVNEIERKCLEDTPE